MGHSKERNNQERPNHLGKVCDRTLCFVFHLSLLLIPIILATCVDSAFAQTPKSTPAAPSFQPSLVINTSGANGLSNTEVYTGLKISILLSLLTLLPSLILSVTCFSRIAIVLSLTRQAIGTGQTPPTQVLVGLSMFLTIAVMNPVIEQIYNDAFLPYSEDQLTHDQALSKAFTPLRTFMLKQTRQEDLELFIEVLRQDPPASPEELGPSVVIPAFILSELNTAFQIAFLIFLPFLILDMIISSVLTSMSMITLPPTVISLPLKLMLFVLVDGWHLIIGSLVKSYTMH